MWAESSQQFAGRKTHEELTRFFYCDVRRVVNGSLGDLLDFTVANTRRADANPAAGAVDERTDGLQIDVPAALRHIVRVADAVTELRSAATNLTNSCHKTQISK